MDSSNSIRKWFHVCSLLTLCSLWGCSHGSAREDNPSDSGINKPDDGSETENENTQESTGESTVGNTSESPGDVTQDTRTERPSSATDGLSGSLSPSGTPTGSAQNSSTSSTATPSSTATAPIVPSCGPKIQITAIIRDFSTRQEGDKPRHPDFEHFGGSKETLGLVQDTLNSEGKPVAALPINTNQLTSAQDFEQWYTDVPGVNYTFQRNLEFVEDTPGLYEYDNSSFFPIGPDEGWGKQGLNRNFGFTTEISLQFQYKAGQTFTFRGDDDLWLFIDGKLALDIGGLHPQIEKTLDLDVVGPQLGLVLDRLYTMKIFHAERHSEGSNFRVRSNIGCFFEPG